MITPKGRMVTLIVFLAWTILFLSLVILVNLHWKLALGGMVTVCGMYFFGYILGMVEQDD